MIPLGKQGPDGMFTGRKFNRFAGRSITHMDMIQNSLRWAHCAHTFNMHILGNASNCPSIIRQNYCNLLNQCFVLASFSAQQNPHVQLFQPRSPTTSYFRGGRSSRRDYPRYRHPTNNIKWQRRMVRSGTRCR